MEIKDFFSKYIMIIDEVEDSKKIYSSDRPFSMKPKIL